MLVFSAVPLFGLLAAFPFLPESPRFLLMSGKEEEARKVLEAAAASVRLFTVVLLYSY